MNSRRIPLWNYLYDIDLFGKEIELYYKGRNKRVSLTGIIFTILYIIIIVSYCIFRFINLFKRTVGFHYDFYQVNEKPPFMELNNELFYLRICIQHPETGKCFIDQSIYTINVTYDYYKKAEGLDFQWEIEIDKNLPIEECQLSKFGSNYQEIFKKRNLKGINCL